MKDLITYTILAIIGYFVGSKMREHRWVTKWTGRIQTAAIAILLFTMGLRMGSNDEVTDHLSSIGLISVAMTLAIMLLSSLSAALTRRCIGMDRWAVMQNREVDSLEETVTADEKSGKAQTVDGRDHLAVCYGWTSVRLFFRRQPLCRPYGSL